MSISSNSSQSHENSELNREHRVSADGRKPWHTPTLIKLSQPQQQTEQDEKDDRITELSTTLGPS